MAINSIDWGNLTQGFNYNQSPDIRLNTPAFAQNNKLFMSNNNNTLLNNGLNLSNAAKVNPTQSTLFNTNNNNLSNNLITAGYKKGEAPSLSNLWGTFGTSVQEANDFNAARLNQLQGLNPDQIIKMDALANQQALLDSQNLWSGIGTGLNVASGLFDAGMSYLGYKQAQEALDFKKDSWTQDFAMRKADYERQIARQENKDEFFSG